MKLKYILQKVKKLRFLKKMIRLLKQLQNSNPFSIFIIGLREDNKSLYSRYSFYSIMLNMIFLNLESLVKLI